jgi:hypothetical protein
MTHGDAPEAEAETEAEAEVRRRRGGENNALQSLTFLVWAVRYTYGSRTVHVRYTYGRHTWRYKYR